MKYEVRLAEYRFGAVADEIIRPFVAVEANDVNAAIDAYALAEDERVFAGELYEVRPVAPTLQRIRIAYEEE